MPKGVVAGTEDGLVLFAGEEIAVQTVRSIEMEQTGDVDKRHGALPALEGLCGVTGRSHQP
jgi:hypothetical protein